MLFKKDFKIIAEIIKDTFKKDRGNLTHEQRKKLLIDNIVLFCRLTNRDFDEETFIKATEE